MGKAPSADDKRRSIQAEINRQAEAVILEMIEKEIVAIGARGIYAPSYAFLKNLVTTIARMQKAGCSFANLRHRALFDCVWSYFSRSNDGETIDRVSEIVTLLEWMIDEEN
jgi:hypothetical protein